MCWTDWSRPLGQFQRISIGFPGVVRGGRVLTAPNLDTKAWHDFPLAQTLAERLGAPARLANDATVQGLGVIAGHGLECVITLGTGMGFALFEDGRPGAASGTQPAPGARQQDLRPVYRQRGAARRSGRKRWNRRVRKAIGYIATLTNFDALYIGGGNSRHVQGDLPEHVRIVSNEAGITGGIRLWDATLDAKFVVA